MTKTRLIQKMDFYLFCLSSMLFFACASPTSVSFLCDNEDLQIYVNNEYVGKGLVRYTAPKGITTAEVECKDNGVTVYSKTYYIKGYNNALFDIKVPQHNYYSSDRQFHSK